MHGRLCVYKYIVHAAYENQLRSGYINIIYVGKSDIALRKLSMIYGCVLHSWQLVDVEEEVRSKSDKRSDAWRNWPGWLRPARRVFFFSAAVCRLVVSLAIQRIQCHLSDMTNRTYAKLHPVPVWRAVPSCRHFDAN